MPHPFDFAVFIGRFQPFHSGDLQVVNEGLKQADKLILLLGSAGQARSARNPWTYQEREQMVRACLSEADNARLLCSPLEDMPYNDQIWLRNVQAAVGNLVSIHHTVPGQPAVIALMNYKNGLARFDINPFPDWHDVTIEVQQKVITAQVRRDYFTGSLDQLVDDLTPNDHLPNPIARFLLAFTKSESYRHVREEMLFVQKYQDAWKAAPYPPTLVTVDSVVVQSGHVLLIKRRDHPGKGLWALPGGFLDPAERLQDACLRELQEETQLNVAASLLQACIKRSRAYDDPDRSARGRTITHAFYIELAPDAQLPEVRASDDAKDARWVRLCDLELQNMCEDHYFIIQDLLRSA